MKTFMRTSAFLLVTSAIILQADSNGFSGKWVLDNHSTQPPNAPKKLETQIKQDGSEITIESRFQEPSNGIVPLVYLGLMADKVKLNTDGQEAQNTIGPFQMAAKSTVDGNAIQTDWTAQVKDDQVKGHWTHRLSDDGKHMTWEIQETSTHGQQGLATLTFVKK
ncbi:MAG TPA: hypothetical protein VF146_13260 [Bryobacteraceae bacterium]